VLIVFYVLYTFTLLCNPTRLLFTYLDLVEMLVKSGGQVYLSRDSSAPLVTDASMIDESAKYLMLVPCRLWHTLSDDERYAINKHSAFQRCTYLMNQVSKHISKKERCTKTDEGYD